MASLTPLSKGLIALAVVGGMASAVWHLALKERLAQPTDTTTSKPTIATEITPNNSVVLPRTPTQPPPDAIPAPSAFSATDPSADTATGRSLVQKGDFSQARPYLERAVQNGSGVAACLLGEMTLQGQGGIPADQEAAAKLFQLAQSHNIICFAPGQ